MTQVQFSDLLQQMVWMMLLVSFPVLLTSMLVGVGISIFQAVTQIQESTLTFVPKILVSFLVLVITGPWMTEIMIQYGNELFTSLADFAK